MFQICRNTRSNSLEGTGDFPHLCPAQRKNSDEMAIFLLEQQGATGVSRTAVDATIGAHMQLCVESSLLQTAEELHASYPEELADIVRLRARSYSELSAFVEYRNSAVRGTS